MPDVTLTIRTVYRGVPIDVHADLQAISSVDAVVQAFGQGQKFVDKMIEKGVIVDGHNYLLKREA